VVVDAASVRTFDLADRRQRLVHSFDKAQPARPPNSRLTGACVAADGKSFVLAWGDGLLEIRDLVTGVVRATGEHGFKNYPFVPIAIAADGRRLILGGRGVVYRSVPTLFDAGSGRKIGELRLEGRNVGQACFLPDGESLALLLANPGTRPTQMVGVYDLK